VVGDLTDRGDPYIIAVVEDAEEVPANAAEAHQTDPDWRHGDLLNSLVNR
jgi:hypothetical protein